jgi:pimeloyl-ACP methyl ester carboxylesterase
VRRVQYGAGKACVVGRPVGAWFSRLLIALPLLSIALPALTSAADEHSASVQGRAGEPPLVLAKEGEFFVGGRVVARGSGTLHVDQMYVEYQVPAHRTHRYPLVLVHGGSGTGAVYDGTPDDREGWREFFVRAGYTVYVVDSPTAGRSAYDAATDGPTERAPAGSQERMFTKPEKFRLWPQAHLHDQFPGTGLPGDPAYEQAVEESVPAITDQRRMDEINQAALAALLDRIGPAILLTHSRSGPYGWLTADARPRLVKAIVAVEPNGPPFKNATSTAAQAPPSATDREWGIAYAPLTFDPPARGMADLAPHQLPPQAPDLLGCWQVSGAPRRLVHLARVPVLIVTSEAGYHAQYDQCTAEFLTAAGVRNEHLRLETRGIQGNGHLMMWEKNNLEIASLIDRWLSQHVRASAGAANQAARPR